MDTPEPLLFSHTEWLAFLYVPLAMYEVDTSKPLQVFDGDFHSLSEALILGLTKHKNYQRDRDTFIRSLAWAAVALPDGISYGRLHFGGKHGE